MKIILSYFLFFLSVGIIAQPTVFGVDSLWKSGPMNKRINLVFMGDGFAAPDTANFNIHVNDNINYLFSISPFDNYKNYFNVYRINSISPNSGVTHPGNATDVTEPVIPTQFVTTSFNTQFDNYGIHRLIYSNNSTAIYSVMANYLPNYDQLIILGNSPEYGGAGGDYAVSSIHTSSKEIIAHEMGHSFANLSDEYWAGPQYAGEKANMTANSNTLTTTWFQWIGDNGINVYPYGTTAPANAWFRPHQNCKMRYLNQPFCSVCKETIIEKIHSLTNPIDAYSPSSASTVTVTLSNQLFKTNLVKPNPNTLKSTWDINSSVVANNVDSLLVTPSMLAIGNNTLTFSVLDTNYLSRDLYHSTYHTYNVVWNVRTNVAGIESITPKIEYSFFPNPANEELKLDYTLLEETDVNINVIDNFGKIIYDKKLKKQSPGNYKNNIDLKQFVSGNYILQINLNQQILHNKFIIVK